MFAVLEASAPGLIMPIWMGWTILSLLAALTVFLLTMTVQLVRYTRAVAGQLDAMGAFFQETEAEYRKQLKEIVDVLAQMAPALVGMAEAMAKSTVTRPLVDRDQERSERATTFAKKTLHAQTEDDLE